MNRLGASTWQPVDWGFIPSRVILKTLKIVFAAFAPGARHKRKCEEFCASVVRHVMSLNSVQSFVIENCNEATIENGLNNVCYVFGCCNHASHVTFLDLPFSPCMLQRLSFCCFFPFLVLSNYTVCYLCMLFLC